MFCAKTVQETKETNKACSEFLKQEGRLTWQELEKLKEKREEKKLKNLTLMVSVIAIIISIISLIHSYL